MISNATKTVISELSDLISKEVEFPKPLDYKIEELLQAFGNDLLGTIAKRIEKDDLIEEGFCTDPGRRFEKYPKGVQNEYCQNWNDLRHNQEVYVVTYSSKGFLNYPSLWIEAKVSTIGGETAIITKDTGVYIDVEFTYEVCTKLNSFI